MTDAKRTDWRSEPCSGKARRRTERLPASDKDTKISDINDLPALSEPSWAGEELRD
jgi:hypothetical protein